MTPQDARTKLTNLFNQTTGIFPDIIHLDEILRTIS
jgi:hypothetical protein